MCRYTVNRVVPTISWCIFLFWLAAANATDNSDVRVVGGFPALQESTMHQVSIRRKSNDIASFGSGHICGGSLITSNKVVTAAHCMVDEEDIQRDASFFRIVGGNLERMKYDANTIVRNVSKIIIHEQYEPETFANDLAVMILSMPISTTHPTLQPIAMTTVQPKTSDVCQASGWGSTRFGLPYASEILLAVNLTVQPVENCNASTSYNGGLLPGMICVGQFEGGRDTCQGDSGGPLVCGGVLAGVVSFGYGCATPGYPGVYTDVAYYRNWIEANGVARNCGISLLLVVCLLFFSLIISS